jgi:hypothetical protein
MHSSKGLVSTIHKELLQTPKIKKKQGAKRLEQAFLRRSGAQQMDVEECTLNIPRKQEIAN